MNKDITQENANVYQFIIDNKGKMTWAELAVAVNAKFHTSLHGESLRNRYRRSLRKGVTSYDKTPSEQVALDLARTQEKREEKSVKKQYEVALNKIESLEKVVLAVEATKQIDTYVIKPQKGMGGNEAVAVVLASDHHIEETVKLEEVNGRNEHNLEISKRRQEQFFQGALRLTEICGRDVKINTMVLALLGDFITNDIHEEMLETTELRPIEAIIECQNRLASGIEFLLKNSKLNLVIPCHSGNHSRTTMKTRKATEAGHSLEYVMYNSLANYFRHEKRVKFLISKSYHSYVEVFDTTIRFHHGHNVRYGGGVGGIYIPVNKAIAQWNKLRWADIDCFGHFHQRVDGGNFLANGCTIGYNAYALSIKAGFEKPSQTFFLVDKKRGRTCVWPVLVD